MKIQFSLTMNNVVIGHKLIDQVILEWNQDIEAAHLMAISARWINSPRFLTTRMDGMNRVGESSLAIEPI